MAKKGFIYKITSPTGRIYVGKTINLSSRKSSYRNNNNKEQRIIYNSINKYGWDNHVFEVIDEAPINLLSEFEIKHIENLKSYHHENPNGMNLTKGGDGALGRKDSKETKLKRTQHHIGRKCSEETKKLMSLAKKGKPSNRKGKKLSKETIEKIRLSSIGIKQSKKTINKRLNTKLDNMLIKKGPILQINPVNNEVIKEWEILPAELSNKLNIENSSLLKALKGKYKTSGGYIWKYKNVN